MCGIRRELLLMTFKADIEEDDGLNEFEAEYDDSEFNP